MAKIATKPTPNFTFVALFLCHLLLIALTTDARTSEAQDELLQDELLQDELLNEARARTITRSSIIDARLQSLYRRVRCPVCAGQPISESDAPLSRILREELAKKIEAGASDEEALAWLVARYGEGVLLSPRFSSAALLWLAPLLLACASLLVLRARTRVRLEAK